MTTRFGYACLNMSLCAEKPKIFCSRGMIKRTFQAKGVKYASELALANSMDLIKYVAWNNAHGVKIFRVTYASFLGLANIAYRTCLTMTKLSQTLQSQVRWPVIMDSGCQCIQVNSMC